MNFSCSWELARTLSKPSMFQAACLCPLTFMVQAFTFQIHPHKLMPRLAMIMAVCTEDYMPCCYAALFWETHSKCPRRMLQAERLTKTCMGCPTIRSKLVRRPKAHLGSSY